MLNPASNVYKFPDFNHIPPEFKPEILNQVEYLCNGELVPWHGKVIDVFSPIYENTDGKITQIDGIVY